MKNQKPWVGHLSALITILIWASTFISTKLLLEVFSPIEIMVFRFIFAWLALFIASPKILKIKSLKEEGLFAAAGLCGVTLYFLLQNTALSLTLASNVSVLISVAPLFTALLSWIFLKDKSLSLFFVLGFAAAIIGIALISFNGQFNLNLNPIGDLLAILSALAWAIYSLLIKKISALPYSLIQSTRKIFFYGLLLVLPFLGLFNFRLDLSRFSSLPVFLNLVFLGVGASAFCFVSWNFAVNILGAVRTSKYIYLSPIFSVFISVIVLKEKITWIAVLGVAMILVGLFLSEQKTILKVSDSNTSIKSN